MRRYFSVDCESESVSKMRSFYHVSGANYSSLPQSSFGSSMEIGVKVEIEHVSTGVYEYCCGAYLTFVSVNELGAPCKIRKLIPDDCPFGNVRFEDALKRRQSRLAERSIKNIFLPLNLYQDYSQKRQTINSRNSPSFDSCNNRDWNEKPAQEAPEKAEKTLQNSFLSVLIQDTVCCTTHIVMPNHANTLKVTFGGQIMEWMEQSAYISASRFWHTSNLLTASVDSLQFLQPTRVGDLVYIISQVTSAYKSSIEVIVTVYAQSYYIHESETSQSRIMKCKESLLCNSAFFTIVNPNESDFTPELIYSSAFEESLRDFDEKRKQKRLLSKQTMIKSSH
eukprot:Sdes_comp20751_c0_seq3m16684